MIVPRPIGVWAFLVLAALSLALSAEPAGLPVPVEEQRVLDALAAGRAQDAIAGLPAAVGAREAQAAIDPAAAAMAIDDLAASVFQGAGGSEAAVAAADAAVRRALDLRTRSFGEHSAETAKSFNTMLTFAYLKGRWDDAESWGRRALAVQRDALPAGDLGLAESLNSLGVVLVRQGRLAEAEPPLAESVRVYTTSPGDHVEKLLDARNSLAELYRQQDRLVDSERTFREAIASAERLGPAAAPLLARLENNLAGLLKDEGNLAEAEALTRRSLALREGATPPDPADLSVGNLNLAEIYRLEGNAAEAEPLYLKSIELARAGLGPDHPDLATHLGQLAVLYRDTGRIEDARRLSDEAAELLERTLGPDHPLLAQTLQDRGVLETGAGRPAVALPKFRRALAIREKAYGRSHFEVASTLTELARAELAPAVGQTGRAVANLNRALQILDTTQAYPETAIDARVLRAGIARRRGDVTAAGADFVAAAASIESLRPRAGGGEATRAVFLAKHAVVYEELIDLLLSQGRIEDAFAWSERARGRALLDQLASAGVDLRQGIPEPKRSELRARGTAARAVLAEWQARSDAVTWRDDLEPGERRTRLDEAQRELANAVAGLRRVDEETKNESALWRSSSGGEPASLDAARRLLSPGERIYTYQVGTTGSWLIEIPQAPVPPEARRLVVGPKAAHELGLTAGPLTRAGLEKVLDSPAGLLAEIERRPVPGFPDDSPRALAALFEILIPAASRAAWAAASGVVVIPDGPLSRLPFEALVRDAGVGGDAPVFWIDEGPAVRYAVSATLLRALAGRPSVPASGGLLSVADPDYGPPGSSRWQPLPGTARESDAVTAAFRTRAPGVSLTVLRGAEAGEPAVRAALEGKRYLHLAVHGVVDEGRGDLLAALALAPSRESAHGSSDDGLLQLFEIYDLQLDCEVAVLSACATQAGAAVAGEGVFALSRGFLARGTRRVIASQWEVDDASTATLVAAFFESVAGAEADGRPADYAATLASAKRKVRSDPATAAPFYWAPFVLSGLR
jgi:CHAT domain-containing protein/tetratricopeptide (TPR) repeat protein